MSTPKPHFYMVRCETDRATNVRTVLLCTTVDGVRLHCEERWQLSSLAEGEKTCIYEAYWTTDTNLRNGSWDMALARHHEMTNTPLPIPTP